MLEKLKFPHIRVFSTKLDPNPKTFDPHDDSTIEQYGKIPTLYTKYILRSESSEDFVMDVPSDDESSDLEEIMKTLGKSNEDILSSIAEWIPKKLKTEIFPRVLFLGTGAADSFMLRNSSGTLVHLS